jgi:hypothetical protein
MKQAALDEQARKLEASRKRVLPVAPEDLESNKRPKLEHVSATNLLAEVDFSVLPPSLLTEFMIANLQAISEQALKAAVQVCPLRFVCPSET